MKVVVEYSAFKLIKRTVTTLYNIDLSGKKNPWEEIHATQINLRVDGEKKKRMLELYENNCEITVSMKKI